MSYQVLSAHILQRGKGLKKLTTKGENSSGEDLCDYCIRAVNYTLHYLRLSLRKLNWAA